MADNDKLKALVADLDAIKTWFSPGSARHLKVAEIADALAEHAGGRDELQPGDPNLATPGPGVKAPTAPVEVDSVGEVADTPVVSKPVVKPTDLSSQSVPGN